MDGNHSPFAWSPSPVPSPPAHVVTHCVSHTFSSPFPPREISLNFLPLPPPPVPTPTPTLFPRRVYLLTKVAPAGFVSKMACGVLVSPSDLYPPPPPFLPSLSCSPSQHPSHPIPHAPPPLNFLRSPPPTLVHCDAVRNTFLPSHDKIDCIPLSPTHPPVFFCPVYLLCDCSLSPKPHTPTNLNQRDSQADR